MQKKILFLGAGDDQVPAIQYAKEAGYYVITCDYLPDNPGHQYGDEYHDVNTTDKEAVLRLAKNLDLDAVLSYGTDANAPIQAYVCEHLGLSTNPYDSVFLLTHKDKFRVFLKENGFYAPKSNNFKSYKVLSKSISDYQFPIIIKPVDSSGSNGISKVYKLEQLHDAYEKALQYSRSKTVIMEEFFEYIGSMYDMEGFLVKGKLEFVCIGDNVRIDAVNPLLPLGSRFPTSLSEEQQTLVRNEFQRLFSLLNMMQGPFNAEFAFNEEGILFIVDIGPRNGGKIFPRAIGYATGANLFKFTVDDALGFDCKYTSKYQKVKTPAAFLILFSQKNGSFLEMKYENEIKENIIKESIYVSKGEGVHKGNRGADRIGEVYFKFNSIEEMRNKMNRIDDLVNIVIEEDVV